MPYLSPPSLTRTEQETLLRVSSCHPRDHMIFSLALGTGRRRAEIVGLNVGDVFTGDGMPRSRIRLRREIAKGGRADDVFLPDALGPKIVRFRAYKLRGGESLAPSAPLFANQSGSRISKRRVQMTFKTWQERAGFDRIYGFHWIETNGMARKDPMTSLARFAISGAVADADALPSPVWLRTAGGVLGNSN